VYFETNKKYELILYKAICNVTKINVLLQDDDIKGA